MSKKLKNKQVADNNQIPQAELKTVVGGNNPPEAKQVLETTHMPINTSERIRA
ncbi:MAG: hypothetical protein K0S11_1864 [Gammaproteobacteria bacterium]|jgi:hypothetical protein|nr:hypothetical protein [Gammaproteobacteria bacterium]